MKFVSFILLLFICLPTLASTCEVDENKFSDVVELIDAGYGNFIVSAPTIVDSKTFQTMYLVIENKDGSGPLIQGELRSTIADDLAKAHINVSDNNGLNAYITLYWEPVGGGCPTIVRKRV
jgi:hypothetical protein